MAQTVTTIKITANNAHLLQGGLDDWLPDVGHRWPMVAVVKNERAVALCASVRITMSAHEAGVETLPEYRRRGYAVRTVRAWASAVRANGATPFYSTSWSNTASQQVASALGLAMIGSDFSIT